MSVVSAAFIIPSCADDSAFLDLRYCEKDLFNFTGIDILATGDNHIFQSVNDENIAFFVDITDIA